MILTAALNIMVPAEQKKYTYNPIQQLQHLQTA